MVAAPVLEDCCIKHLAATAALPGIKGTNEIIVGFRKHATIAPWTFHGIPLPSEILEYTAWASES